MGLVSVLIDSREPPAIKTLTFDGAPTVVTYLEHGDLLAACNDGETVLVERKTAGDLLSTLEEGRLFEQLGAMPAITPWSYLVVTGPLQPDAAGNCIAGGSPRLWRWSAIQGAFVTANELGVGVYVAASERDYAATILQLVNRNRDSVRTAPQRNTLAVTPAAHILTGFPGVGDTHAQALLEYCGTAGMAIQYLTGAYPLTKVPGVGPGTRQRARQALGIDPDYEMVVAMTEESHKALVKRAYTDANNTAVLPEKESVTP